LRVAHVELDEGSGQPLDLPGRARLAGAEAHDDVADAHRLAGLQRQIARQAVPLVEQADDGDPLGHRRGAGLELSHHLRDIDRLRLRFGLGLGLGPRNSAAVAGCGGKGGRKDAEPHPYSGVQAW